MPEWAVAITTFNRRPVFEATLAAYRTHTPPDVPIIVVDDGSAVPVPDLDGVIVHRNPSNTGVGAAKNRCLQLAMDLDPPIRHLLLSDDDCRPITDGYWEPYLTDPLPHLMHCWGRSRYIRTENHHTLWSWPRGVLLYVERRVVERVGGMRTETKWGGEHAEWSRRICNAGFTPHPFIDVAAARTGIWHCVDYRREVPSSVTTALRDGPESVRRRHAMYARHRHSTDYVDFRG